MFFVPPRKKSEVAKEIMRLLAKSKNSLPARRVARVAGLCISLSCDRSNKTADVSPIYGSEKVRNGIVILSQAAIQNLE